MARRRIGVASVPSRLVEMNRLAGRRKTPICIWAFLRGLAYSKILSILLVPCGGEPWPEYHRKDRKAWP